MSDYKNQSIYSETIKPNTKKNVVKENEDIEFLKESS